MGQRTIPEHYLGLAIRIMSGYRPTPSYIVRRLPQTVWSNQMPYR